MQRRHFLKIVLGTIGGILLMPVSVLAAAWNKLAFEATSMDVASKNLNVASEQPSKQIEIVAPDKAENGAVVQVEVISHIPNSEAIAILVEKNPTPLIANFMFSNGAEPYVITRIKMAETSDIKAIVKVGDRYYSATRKVEVLENGCG